MIEKYNFSIAPFILQHQIKNETVVITLPKYVPIFFLILKNHFFFQFSIISCISGVDLIGKWYRFSVSYDLLSISLSTRLRIKAFVNEITPMPTLCNVYINANWWEREIWDLFGIFFEGHPDLRRLLSDYGFEGFPLRKDFPLYGYVELRYDENQKRIVAEPVELTQDFRLFDFTMPW